MTGPTKTGNKMTEVGGNMISGNLPNFERCVLCKRVSIFSKEILMTSVLYRKATNQDVSALAKIRGDNFEAEEYWYGRISGYMKGAHNPQKALDPRIIY